MKRTMKKLPACAIALGLITVACSREQGPAVKENAAPQPTSTGDTLTDQLATGCSEDQFNINGMRSDPELGPVFFAHPQSQCSLPVQPDYKYVRFSFGIFDTAIMANPPTDGVDFRLLGQGPSGQLVPIWERSLRPATVQGDKGPQSAVVPLIGLTKLVFETKPASTSKNDWAYWRGIALERKLDLVKILADNKKVDQFRIAGLRTLPGLGQVLFAHPSSQFVLPVLGQTKAVRFRFGLLDAAVGATPATDGVEFRLSVHDPKGTNRIWSRTLRPSTIKSDRGTKEVTLPVKLTEGSRLVFETLPAGGWENDWAYWSDVSLIPAN
jgi:hypothetical protein